MTECVTYSQTIEITKKKLVRDKAGNRNAKYLGKCCLERMSMGYYFNKSNGLFKYMSQKD